MVEIHLIIAYLLGAVSGGSGVFIFNLTFRHAVEAAVKAEVAKLVVHAETAAVAEVHKVEAKV